MDGCLRYKPKRHINLINRYILYDNILLPPPRTLHPRHLLHPHLHRLPQHINPLGPLNLPSNPLALPLPQTNRPLRHLQRIQQKPSPQPRCAFPVIVRRLGDAVVRVSDLLTIEGPAKGFVAEVEGDGGADVVAQLLHAGDGCGDAAAEGGGVVWVEVGKGLEDEVLDHELGGAVGVPGIGDPDVLVEVAAAVVDVEFAFVAREVVEGVRGFIAPFFGDAVGPGGDLGFDAGGVVEDLEELIFRGRCVGVSEDGICERHEIGQESGEGGQSTGSVLEIRWAK